MDKSLHLPLIATLCAAVFVSACSGPDMPAEGSVESAAKSAGATVASTVPPGSCDQY